MASSPDGCRMYFMGHAGLGLLLALPLTLLRRRMEGRDALGLTPGLLLLCVVAANMADFLHFELTRALTHNFVAWAVMSVALGLLFRQRLGLDRLDLGAIALAGLAHPIGDLLFSSYFPLYPIDPGLVVQLYEWNTPFHFAVEIPLAAVVVGTLLNPRLAGRSLSLSWQGRGDPLLRLAVAGTILLLGASLVAFLQMNFLSGAPPGLLATTLFAEGAIMAVPLFRIVLNRPRGDTALAATTAAPEADSGPPG